MIIQFKCSNYRSIKGEVTFSMTASSDDSLNENLITSQNGNKYLRLAEIYGANGSGKTSLLNAISLMSKIVLESYSNQLGDKLLRNPHKLNQNEPTTFSMLFIKNKIKYAYGFSYTDEKVTDEYLYCWKSRKKKMIFERDENAEFEFGEEYKKEGSNCKGRLKNNRLLLSCATSETNITEIAETFLFFKSDLIIYPNEPNNWFEYSVKQLQNNSEMKKTFIDFMNDIGSKIKDIKINNSQLSDLKIEYEKFTIDLAEESSGVQKLFRFLCPIIEVLHSEKIFICDEIDSHLHPAIVFEIVRRFCQNKVAESQAILTTHNTDLLDLELVRRDQIWFTELKENDHSTDLYSLLEIRNVRKSENIKKGYLIGKYGAVPFLNSSKFNEVNNETR